MSPAKRRRLVHEGLTSLFLRLSREQPLILWFEDLHWIDGETQAVLDALVEALVASRILLLVTFRPEFQHGWAGKSSFVQIPSAPLHQRRGRPLSAALCWATIPVSPNSSTQLVERGGGNPLFLEEMVRALAETGRLAGQAGEYRLTGASDAIEMPATIREVLAARIDRLPPDGKALLQVAAVIGKDVPVALLQPILRLSEEELRFPNREGRTFLPSVGIASAGRSGEGVDSPPGGTSVTTDPSLTTSIPPAPAGLGPESIARYLKGAPPEMDQYAFFIGSWDCEVRLSPGGDSESLGFRGEWKAHWVHEGRMLVDDLTIFLPTGEEILGWLNLRTWCDDTGCWEISGHRALSPGSGAVTRGYWREGEMQLEFDVGLAGERIENRVRFFGIAADRFERAPVPAPLLALLAPHPQEAAEARARRAHRGDGRSHDRPAPEADRRACRARLRPERGAIRRAPQPAGPDLRRRSGGMGLIELQGLLRSHPGA